ncbi:MAG: hypothetical protein WCA15_04335 [Candidatus Acidiferrales bacterium]
MRSSAPVTWMPLEDSLDNLRPVLWQEAFIRAVDEPDREALARLIREAERAICLRRLQLENPADYRNEVRAMDIATQAMDAIKVQKLGVGRKLAAWHDCRAFQKSA